MRPTIIVTAEYEPLRSAFIHRDNYIRAVEEAGGAPVFVGDDPVLSALFIAGRGDADAVAARYDGLLLTGGGDIAAHLFGQEPHPMSGAPALSRDTAEIALCRAFDALRKPVLGICRGMQIMNVALGGALLQDIPSMMGMPYALHYDETARHPIVIEPSSWLFGLLGWSASVNSTHHQAVDVPAPGFEVAARFDDVIEAMNRGDALGVQFHPERILEEGFLCVFEDFVRRCGG